jgi:Domain of unknown function (DUF5658)
MTPQVWIVSGMSSSFPPTPDDWVSRAGQGGNSGQGARDERRRRPERRRRIWWSLLYGSFRPRRRSPARRTQDARYHAIDWHGAHLWAVSISILTFSVADAFLTMNLLSRGAVEVNPLMAAVIGHNVTVFAALKMAITGVGVMLMVFLARYRFMRVVRVEIILYCIFGAYLVLICHEMSMFRQLAD